MFIFPAIDLLNRCAVRLKQGRYDDATVYEQDPVNLARQWRGKVKHLHVVDLEGARKGEAVQRETVRALVDAFGEGVQVGGGVRSAHAVKSYFDLGVSRVVLGTAAVQTPELVREAALSYPGRIVVSVDAKNGCVAISGWEESVMESVDAVVDRFKGLPLAAILYTDISRDGMRVGPNLATTRALAERRIHPVLASGGISSLDDLKELARIPNLQGAIVGRALYDGVFTLDEAVELAGSC